MKKTTDPPAIVNYYIKPGFIYLADQQTSISAVLGSCVAVCLYDRRLKTGGMNHFLLPEIHKKNSTTPRYGNVATHALVRMMLNNGSFRNDLEAQIFGGAYNKTVSEKKDIGRDNVAIARKTLKKEKIRITSEDTGGNRGRKVVFDTFSNEVAIVRVDRLRQNDWYPYQAN